jgi:AAA15 family ATPase/GTPase
MIYERDSGGVTLGASIKNKRLSTSVSPKMPYLSFLAIHYSIEAVEDACHWFRVCALYDLSRKSPYHFLKDMQKQHAKEDFPFLDKEKFLQMVSEIDIAIDDYQIELTIREDEGKERYEIYTIRNKNGKIYRLNLNEESLGTRKLFHLLSVALFALEVGGVVAMDEMDASLHPKLLRYIIKLFKNPKINKNNAQLLFTSHDLTTMKGDLFRRDEIWFAAKNDEGVSEIYSLYEIRNPDGTRVRADAPFDKHYMLGKYGADPYLSVMLSEEWEAANES